MQLSALSCTCWPQVNTFRVWPGFEKATVGTTNFDSRSFSLDEESNVCVYDSRIAERLEAIFKEDLKHCEQVTLDRWRHRGIRKRIFGEVCVFLKEQI